MSKSLTITITDGLATDKALNSLVLELATTTTTPRKIIEQRVRQEVERYNSSDRLQRFKGLVQPTPEEKLLNGYKQQPHRLIDAEARYQSAIRVFMSNGFFLLIDDHQVTDLDKIVQLTEISTIQFIRLLPLVGG